MTGAPWRLRWRSLALGALTTWALTACGGSDGEEPAQPAPDPIAPTQPRGHWYKAREDLAPDDPAGRASALETIGYASGMESADGRAAGIGFLAETRVQPGLNFYTSGHGPEAFLMGSTGEVLHRWRQPIGEIWPGKDVQFAYFRKARLFSEGRVLAIFEGYGMVALDAASNVLWHVDRPMHHDVHEAPDGSFYALDRSARVVPRLHPDRPLLDDGIVFIDQDGAIRGRVSLLDGLLSSDLGSRAEDLIARRISWGLKLEDKVLKERAAELAANPALLKHVDYVGDCLHTNSVRRIGPQFAAACDVLEEGWFLVSIRELNLLVAFEVEPDYSKATARWMLRGPWRKQHEAVPLPSGAIMLFDNAGRTTGGQGRRSRVIDIDPSTGEILRSIDGVPGVDLHSTVGGSCQRLANGNTLVIESTRGSAYEVTPAGALAWSFHNPHRAGQDEELIAFLPDVIRIPEASIREWLPHDD